jgi:V8-like Glu-specific endopeptidase
LIFNALRYTFLPLEFRAMIQKCPTNSPKNWRVTSALFFALLGASFFTLAHAQGAVFLGEQGQDSRQAMTSDKYPWSAIGRVVADNGDGTESVCTGALVGQTTVLTAAHCVLANGQVRAVVFQSNYVNRQYDDQSASQNITVGTTDPDGDRANDWAVIQIADDLGDKQGWLATQLLSASDLTFNVHFAGYSSDFDDGDTAGADYCTLRTLFNDGTFGHDCSTDGGASGGPLFYTDSNNDTYIVAIDTRGDDGETYSQYSASAANIAVMTSDLRNTIAEYNQ